MKHGTKRLASLDALSRAVRTARKAGKRIVATNGAFDLLHYGHIYSLEQARAHGDYLIVGVNSDASVRRSKGSLRPIIPHAERAHHVAALSCVDAVFVFSTTTAHSWLRVCKPDVYVKGSDRTMDQILERELVEGYGGRVVRIPHTKKHSTSKLIQRIIDTHR